MKKKLYIGCALTIIPEDKRKDFLQMISNIKFRLKDSFEIMEFLGAIKSDGSPKDVYTHDIKNCVMKADYMLAICDYPSLGLGYEIATAVEKQSIPTLAVAHKNSKVTNLIKGIDHKDFNFFTYESVEQIVQKTIETLTK